MSHNNERALSVYLSKCYIMTNVFGFLMGVWSCYDMVETCPKSPRLQCLGPYKVFVNVPLLCL